MPTFHSLSRILAAGVLGAALLIVARPARAHDAAVDGAHEHDAAAEAAPTPRDAAVSDASHLCIGINEPCTRADTCCVSNAYCGSFQSMSDNLVCGVDADETLPTGSCGVAGASGMDAATMLLGALGVIAAVRGRRRR